MGRNSHVAPAPLSLQSSGRRTDSFGSNYSTDTAGKETSRASVDTSYSEHQQRPSSNRRHHTWASSSRQQYSPTVNHYTHCGRHTDQYLFGGHTLKNFVRSAFNKKDS
ncbi:hypothetical protein F4780DRAFT_780856 [Xylariomycetidae sp. FL0641]|nr:hypothetical protein F4780DRAFT_780856 [Xylariomycetidae sp. FL0641]